MNPKLLHNTYYILSSINIHCPSLPYKKISFLQKEKIIFVMSIEPSLYLCRDTRTYVHSPFRDQNINEITDSKFSSDSSFKAPDDVVKFEAVDAIIEPTVNDNQV